MDQKFKYEELVTEEELLKLFGVSKEGLRRLRADSTLPYVKISKTQRIYLTPDLMAWFASKRQNV
jgi:hypothetical protein